MANASLSVLLNTGVTGTRAADEIVVAIGHLRGSYAVHVQGESRTVERRRTASSGAVHQMPAGSRGRMNRHRFCWWCFYFGFGLCSRLTPGASSALAGIAPLKQAKARNERRMCRWGSPLAR